MIRTDDLARHGPELDVEFFGFFKQRAHIRGIPATLSPHFLLFDSFCVNLHELDGARADPMRGLCISTPAVSFS